MIYILIHSQQTQKRNRTHHRSTNLPLSLCFFRPPAVGNSSHRVFSHSLCRLMVNNLEDSVKYDVDKKLINRISPCVRDLVVLLLKPPTQLGRVHDFGYMTPSSLQNGRHLSVALNLMLFLQDLWRRRFRLRLLPLSGGGWDCFGSTRVKLPAQDGPFCQKLISHVPG